MRERKLLISLSSIDEERFGIKTAKLEASGIADIPDALKFCKENEVHLLIARCSTNDIHAVQEMERQGFLLMDTLVYYSCDLRKNPPPEYVSEIEVRPFKDGEEDIIRSIAAEAFDSYLGHYHSDSRLDKSKCNETYMDWAYRSCLSKELADEVFVAELKGKIIGFGTVRANSPDEGQYVLAGILRSYQGLGAYRLILINCMRWCIERGIGTILFVTQVTNLAVQKVFIRLGIEPSRSYYTFHKWFDLAPESNSHDNENL